MKKLCLILLVAFGFIANSQISFGVSPGFGFNSSYLGYNINNKLITYVGFQYFNSNFKYNETGEFFDDNIGEIVSYNEKFNLAANIYLPNIGFKYFAIQ
jgi:hypothetical protein